MRPLPDLTVLLRLDRAPFALPSWLDLAAERAAALRPRQRQLIAAVACTAVTFGVVRPRPHPWGPVTTVVMLTRTLDAGEVIGPDDAQARAWPTALAPPSPMSDPADAVGRRLATRTLAGSVLDRDALTSRTPAQRAPAGWGAVPVALDRLPALGAGTILDVHGGNGRFVQGAIVLAVDAGAVWLGVPRAQVAELAAALDWGDVHVAIWADADGASTG